MTARSWIRCTVSAAIAVVLGFGIGYWYWSTQAELLHLMDATNRVELFANLLRQLERNDVEGAKAAHRDLIKNAGVSLDALAPSGSQYGDMPEVVAARRTLHEIDAHSR